MPSLRPPKTRARVSVQTGPGAIDLLEESVHRLRLSSWRALNYYYVGTLPFVLGLLYFWADLGSNPDAPQRSAGAALSMALLFWWMKSFHAVFASELRARLSRRPTPPWTLPRVGRLVFVQGVLHSTGLFVVPLAALVTIPLGWVYAFYQNVTVLGDGETVSTQSVAGRAVKAARLWPKQNHAALGIVSFLGIFIWMNIVAAVFIVPNLVSQFTGEDNVFTRSGLHLFNSTFFAVSFSLVYLAVDPLIKAFYALRCFYGDSLRSGEDLKSELRALPSLEPDAEVPVSAAPAKPASAPGALTLVCVLMAAWATCVIAAPSPASPASGKTAPPAIAPETLSKSVEEVLQRPEFAWRAPKTKTARAAEKSALARFFADIGKWITQTWDRFWEWVDKFFPKSSRSQEVSSGAANGTVLRWLIYGLIALVVGAIGCILWQTWRNRRRARKELAGQAQTGAGVTPDLTDDQVLATQLPEDEWLQLARRLRETGERRLALRALYLSLLANLGEHGLLAIARHKSNRDYLEELRRRARDRFGEAPDAFARNVRQFERVWYGRHAASDETLDQFTLDRDAIASALAETATKPSPAPPAQPVFAS